MLLRGNGSPRSFRLSLPAFHRSITTLGFLFAFAILASIISFGLWLGNSNPSSSTKSEETAAPSSSLWQQLKTTATAPPAASDSELQKEVAGLREDIARINSQIDGRKDLGANNSQSLLQFFGPRSSLVPENESLVRIKNPKINREAGNKQVLLDFELHNVDPSQRQARGYIVVLAKTQDLVLSYPPGVFSPTQNIVLDFTRGETFAISRFRQARATFTAAPLENKKAHYQILLFGTDGKVLGNTHVEDFR